MALFFDRSNIDLLGEELKNKSKQTINKRRKKKDEAFKNIEELPKQIVPQEQVTFNQDIDDNFNKLSDAFDSDNELLTTLADLIIPAGWKPTVDTTEVKYYESIKKIGRKGKEIEGELMDVSQLNKNFQTVVVGSKKKIEREREKLDKDEKNIHILKNEIDYKKKAIDEYNKQQKKNDNLLAEIERVKEELKYNTEEYNKLVQEIVKLESKTIFKPVKKIENLNKLVIENDARRIELKNQLDILNEEYENAASNIIQEEEFNKLKTLYLRHVTVYNQWLKKLKEDWKKLEIDERKVKKLEDDITNRDINLKKQSHATTANKTIIQASKERTTLFITTLNKFIKNIVNHKNLFESNIYEIKKINEETLKRFKNSYMLLINTFETFKKSIVSKDGNFKFYLEGLSSLKEKDIQTKFKILLDYYDSLINVKDFIEKSIDEYYSNYNILVPTTKEQPMRGLGFNFSNCISCYDKSSTDNQYTKSLVYSLLQPTHKNT